MISSPISFVLRCVICFFKVPPSLIDNLKVADPAVLAGKRHAIHPASFQLSTNYRSHGGIVDAATSVVSLITKLFPHSIDTLAKEQGMVR